MAERMKNGETRSGPRSSRIRCSRSITSNPPMPLPITTPTRLAFAAVTLNPLASTAMVVAASANWMKRAHFLTSFFSIQGSGSKSFTSPAKRAAWRKASNRVMGAMPDCPASACCQVTSVPTPSGVLIAGCSKSCATGDVHGAHVLGAPVARARRTSHVARRT